MADAITIKALQDASLDAKSLEEVVNGNEVKQVTTRKGETYPSVKKAIKTLFENGGLPAKPFPTKALMTASALTDGDYAQVTDDTVNNGLYVKTAGAWVKSGYDPLLQSKSYTDSAKINAVNDSQVYTDAQLGSVVSFSSNMYDIKKNTPESFLGTDGVIITSSAVPPASVSDFTLIKPLATYTVSQTVNGNTFLNLVFYSSDKTSLGRTDIIGMESGKYTFTAPSNAAYVRFTIADGQSLAYNRMMNVGSEALPYEPYYMELLPVSFSAETAEYIKKELDVTDSARDYIKKSKNLFDDTKTTVEYISGAGVVMPSTGSPTSWYLSDFIPVTAYTEYTVSGEVGYKAFEHVSYFTAERVFIRRVSFTGSELAAVTFTTPYNAAFVRLNMTNGKPTLRNRMLNVGNTPLPYEKGGAELRDVYLSEAILNQISDEIIIKNDGNRFIFDNNINNVYSREAGWTEYGSIATMPAADVYAMYDALMLEHPDYITKETMTPDDLGNPIYCYKFTPERPPTFGGTRHPKIFLGCGIHGNERMPPLDTYLMIKEMCENWQNDAGLEVLRFNVDFIVMPVINPSGWNSTRRLNHNNVDLNRNFPFRWASDVDGYNGTSAASEIETQNVMQVFTDNPDIDVFYDCHNYQKKTPDYYLWISTADAEDVAMQRMGQAFVGRMQRKWKQEYTWMPQENSWHVGYASSSYTPFTGILASYATFNVGVPLAATYEVCDSWTINPSAVKYDEIHTKTAVEALVNWMLINLQELQSR